MNKGELMKLVFTKEELNSIDTAYPQPWADKMREMGVQPRMFVWSYLEHRISGAPVNLAEKFFEKYTGLPEVELQDPDHVGALISAQSLINDALGV